MARDDDDLRALGLGPDADADDVRAARRRLARQVHPDAGGDNAAMASINAAAGRALHALAGPSDDVDNAAAPDDGTGGTIDDDVVVGSVNANLRHYAQAAQALAAADPGWLGRLVSRRVPLADFADAFEARDEDVKVVLDLQA